MRESKLYGVGILISTLFLYWITSYPTVAYIDSGELAVVNWTLGIAHPTGYPLYTLIGHLFSFLPFELVQTQILFGALCVASACAIIYFLLRRLDYTSNSSPFLAGALALLFGVAPLNWSQGTTNEVYSLHLLFLVLIVFLMARPYSRRAFLIGAYIFGLSFGNHMSTILIAPALVVFLVQNRREIFRDSRQFLGAMLLFLFGISTYLYLPIRSALDPLFDWGDPVNWENFVRHVTGWQYQVWMFNQSVAELLKALWKFCVILYEQFPLPFWPAIAWGLYTGWKRHPRLQLYLLILLFANLIYSLNFSIPDIDNYLLPSVLTLFCVGAIGVVDLAESLRRKSPMVIAAAALVIWGVVANWQATDNSQNTSASDGVENYYSSVSPPALIFCANWDYVSPWLYSHYYLKENPQVLIVDNELLRRSWYFGWLQQADSALFNYIRPEYEAFLPHLQRFEADLPYDGLAIERTYQALLKKFTTYNGRRFYFDQSVRLSFQLDGDIKVSGLLFQLVRPGELFIAPRKELALPRFGKPSDLLNWREKWHIELFNSMNAGS